MRPISRGLLLLVGSLYISLGLHAQVSFEAEVSSTTAEVGEQIRLTITVQGTKARAYTPPQLDGLSILSGPSTASEYRISNGRTTQNERISYSLLVERPGLATIGSASIRSANGELKTKPIRITVKASSAVTIKGAPTKQKPVLLDVSMPKDTIYEGEALVVSVNLISQRQIYTYRLQRGLNFEGFRAEELQRFNARKKEIEIDGEKYGSQRIMQYTLYPSRPGLQSLGSMVTRVFLVNGDGRRRGFFIDPATEEYTVISQKDTIVVLPLPANAPNNFSGIVGKWKFQGNYEDVQDLTTAEALTFKLFIQGNGDVNRLSAPELTWPNGWRAYPGELSLDEAIETDTGVVYTRVYEYTVAPSVGGQSMLEPSLSYFDTDSKVYRQWQAQSRVVRVTSVGNDLASDGLASAQEEDSLPVYTGAARPVDLSMRIPMWFYYGIGLSPILVLGGWLYGVLRKRKSSRLSAKPDPRLAGRRRLKAARENVAKPAVFYHEVRVALERFAEQRLGLAASQQDAASITAAFAAAQMPDRATRFLELRATADRGLYGGGTDEAGRRQALDELELLLGD